MSRESHNALRLFFFNSRVEDYERMLRAALSDGYRLGSLLDFIESSEDERFVLLRHDVDIPRQGVDSMLAVERSLGVRSSWYFRWSTAENDLIEEVKAAGGEVGLHFESLACVCDERGIRQQQQVTPAIIEEARSRLSVEIREFRDRFDVPCLTIASHGHPTNTQVRCANNEILTAADYDMLGIVAEAYQPHVIDRMDAYLSDANPRMNGGWAYRQSLNDAVGHGCEKICFLSHPNHWSFTAIGRITGIFKVVILGVTEMERTFRPTFREGDPKKTSRSMGG